MSEREDVIEEGFEALDEVIQEATDEIRDALDELNKTADQRLEAIDDVMQEGFDGVERSIKTLSHKVMIELPSMMRNGIVVDNSKSRIDKIEKDIENIKGLVDKLIKARRVPVYDDNGEIIGVDLKVIN